MSLALPSQLRFDSEIPLDGNCRQEIAVCNPVTGSIYSPGSYFLINIPKNGNNAVLDGANSFLRFQVTNTNGTGDNGQLTLDHSCDSFFSKLEVLCNGNVLETVDRYSILSSCLLDIQVEKDTRSSSLNVTKGCSSDQSSIPLAASGVTITHGASAWFSTTLLSGIVGSLCRNYIPLYAIQGQISIRMTLNPALSVGGWFNETNTANAGTAASYQMSNIEFHAVQIRLSDPVLSMIQSSSYTIYSESWSNFTAAIVNGPTSIEQMIPCRYSSLKTIMLAMQKQSNWANATFLLRPNSRETYGINDYAFRLGSTVVPASRVKCNGSGFIAPFEALKTAFHCGGGSLVPLGIINRASYSLYNNNALGGLFVIAQDLEGFTGKNGAILAGENLTATDLYFSGNFTGGIPSDAFFNYYLHFDFILKIEDGMVSVHV